MTAIAATVLTDRFARAVDYARIAHAAQVRKGTTIPYLTHLLGVATLVIEHGGTEDQAIAGLLHDLIEDCGEAHEPIIRAQFGNAVADIVIACTDGTVAGKSAHTTAAAKRADWLRRKQDYLRHLADSDDAVLLVSACDKLHNALCIVRDLEDPAVGLAVFDRFTGGRDGTLRYYHALHATFAARDTGSAPALDNAISRMHDIAGAQRQSLAGGNAATHLG